MFYLVLKNSNQRNQLIKRLKENGIHAVFHYLSLHKSDYYKNKHDDKELLNADYYTDCLVRLPLFYELSDDDVNSNISLFMATDNILLYGDKSTMPPNCLSTF